MKTVLCLLPAMMLLATLPAMSAGRDSWVELQVGPSMPVGGLHRSAGPGFQGGLSARFMDSDQFGVGVDVAYHAWGVANTPAQWPLSTIAPTWTVETNAIQTTAHGRAEFRPNQRIRPYVEGGWGFYWIEGTLSSAGVTIKGGREQFVCFTAGTGVTLPVNPTLRIGLSSSYHRVVSGQTDVADGGLFTLALRLVPRPSAVPTAP